MFAFILAVLSASGGNLFPASPLLSQIPTLTDLTGSELLLRLLSVLLLIAVNAFFVTAEFSIVSVRRSRINQLVSAGDVQAKTVQTFQRRLDRLLSTTQLGITLSSLALGWIGENTMAVITAGWISDVARSQGMGGLIAHALAGPVAFILIAYLQIVLGELCPKSVALLYPEQLARFLGPPSLALAQFFNPFIWVLNQSTRWLLKLVGIRYTGQGWYNQVTPEELQLIIATSTESSGLEEEERELLNNVFEFSEVTAAAVMIPRTSIAAVPDDATFQMFLDEMMASGHSRYPVIGDSLDEIQGVIYFKELSEPLAQGVLFPDTSLQPWVRSAQFVPEYMPLGELLPLMQRTRQAMVMVVDEFGGTAGLVTLEDVVAEIIGDLSEPQDDEEPAIKILNDHTFLVQAQMDLEEVNDLLELYLPVADEYHTLGGFLLYQLQKVPAPGETLYYRNLELTVVSAEGPRLHQIQIHRLDPPTDDPLPGSSGPDFPGEPNLAVGRENGGMTS